MENIQMPIDSGDQPSCATSERDEFRLSSTSPGVAEEQVLLSALIEIEKENQLRLTRHGQKQALLCFSMKLPIAELRALQVQAARWKIKQTDLTRFLLKLAIPLLEHPTSAVKPVLEANLEIETQRELQRLRQRRHVGAFTESQQLFDYQES
jgi:hypothetical protein